MPLTATSLAFELSLEVSLEDVEVLDEALDLTLRLRGPGLAGGLGVSGTTSAELWIIFVLLNILNCFIKAKNKLLFIISSIYLVKMEKNLKLFL